MKRKRRRQEIKGRKNKQDIQKKKIKIIDLNPIISLIAFNVNGLKHYLKSR